MFGIILQCYGMLFNMQTGHKHTMYCQSDSIVNSLIAPVTNIAPYHMAVNANCLHDSVFILRLLVC